jgi:hypothetical protein
MEWHEAEVRNEIHVASDGSVFKELVLPYGLPPGVVAFNLLAELYGWFGFERDKIPYSSMVDGRQTIDDKDLRMR